MIEVIESPFAGPDRETLDRNSAYLDECLKYSLNTGGHPFASHAYLPRVLNDGVPGERKRGLQAGRKISSALLDEYKSRWVFCVDLGMSPGMVETLILLADQYHHKLVFRSVSLGRDMTAKQVVDALVDVIKPLGLIEDADILRELSKHVRAVLHTRTQPKPRHDGAQERP